MRQIADWLEKLGISEYAQRFAENGISVAALRYLTEDPMDIGVLLGHRRIMLAAFGELGGSGIATSTVEPKTSGAAQHAAEATGERRKLTVMFTDLVGSTALLTSLDPED